MPTMIKKAPLDLKWKLENNGIAAVMYRIGANNARTELSTNGTDAYADSESGLQMARSMSQVSLWK